MTLFQIKGDGTFCISTPDSRIDKLEGSFKSACVVHGYIYEVKLSFPKHHISN